MSEAFPIERGDVYLSRHHAHRWRRMEPVFDGRTIHWLSSVYGEVYGGRFDAALFLSSHLSVVRMSYLALVTTGVLGRFARHGPIPVPLGAARRILAQIRALVHDQNRMDGLASLPNCDLDTGVPDPAGVPPRAVVEILRAVGAA